MSETGGHFKTLPASEHLAMRTLFEEAGGKARWAVSPDALLDRWAATIEECRGEYAFGLEDYKNDLTVRHVIQTLLDADRSRRLRAARSVVHKLDREFRALTRELATPLMDDDEALAEPIKFFYFFRVPKEQGRAIKDDLARMKSIGRVKEAPDS